MKPRALAVIVALAASIAPLDADASHICNEINMFTGVSSAGGVSTGTAGCARGSAAEANTYFAMSGSDFYLRPFVLANRTCNSATPPKGATIGKRRTGGRILLYSAANKLRKTIVIGVWSKDSSNRYVGPSVSVPASISTVKITATVRGTDCVWRNRSIAAQVLA